MPGTGTLRRRQNWTTVLQGSSRRRQNCALLARVVRAAGKGAADELAPSHSVYAYPKNPPQINVAWIPVAEAAVVCCLSLSVLVPRSIDHSLEHCATSTPLRATSLLFELFLIRFNYQLDFVPCPSLLRSLTRTHTYTL